VPSSMGTLARLIFTGELHLARVEAGWARSTDCTEPAADGWTVFSSNTSSPDDGASA